jgi:excisionase family DNA binding protein
MSAESIVPSTSNENKLLTVQEVAAILSVDSNTIRLWAKDGKLESVTLPGNSRHTYRFKVKMLQEKGYLDVNK